MTTPLNISSLALWLDPTSSPTITLDPSGVYVKSIYSRTTSNLKFFDISGVVSAPTLQANALGGSKPMLNFDGTRLLDNSGYNFLSSSHTVFLVQYGTTPAAPTSLVDLSGLFFNTSIDSIAKAQLGNGTLLLDAIPGSNRITFNYEKLRVVCVDISGTADPDNKHVRLFVNDVSGFEISSISSVAFSGMQLGGCSTTNTFFTGLIGDVLIYDTSLPRSNISTVTGYLIDKWGLNCNAPTPPTVIQPRPRVGYDFATYFWGNPSYTGAYPITYYNLSTTTSNQSTVGTAPVTLTLGVNSNATVTVFGNHPLFDTSGVDFRNITTGYIASTPMYQSLYRVSDQSAVLSWSTPVTYPTAGESAPVYWNLVYGAPADSNGNVTSEYSPSAEKKSARGSDTSKIIYLSTLSSYSIYVRSVNDPGYSYIPNNLPINLTKTSVTGDSIFAFKNDANYNFALTHQTFVSTLSPMLNNGISYPAFDWEGILPYSNGFIEKTRNASTTDLKQFTFLDKQGFVDFTTPDLSGAITYTRTNPLVPIMTGVNSNYNPVGYTYGIYNTNTQEYTVSTIQNISTPQLEFFDNSRDTNAYFTLYDSNNSPYPRTHFYIPANATKASSIVQTGNTISTIYNFTSKSLYNVCMNTSNSLSSFVVYVPNSGSPKVLNFAPYTSVESGITALAAADQSLFILGTDENLRTFDFSLANYSTPVKTTAVLTTSNFGATMKPLTIQDTYFGYSNQATFVKGDTVTGGTAIYPLTGASNVFQLNSNFSLSNTSQTNSLNLFTFSNAASNGRYFAYAQDMSGVLSSYSLKTPWNSTLSTGYSLDAYAYPTAVALFSQEPGTGNTCLNFFYNNFSTNSISTGLASFNGDAQNSTITIIRTSDLSGYAFGPSIAPKRLEGAITNGIYTTYPATDFNLVFPSTTTYPILVDLYSSGTRTHSNVALDISGFSNIYSGSDCWYLAYSDDSTVFNLTRIDTNASTVTYSESNVNVFTTSPLITADNFLMVEFIANNIYTFSKATNTFKKYLNTDGTPNSQGSTYLPYLSSIQAI